MIRIIKGGTKEFFVELFDEDDRPFDLTAFDEFKVCFPNDGSPVEVSEVANANGSVVALEGNALLGVLKVTLNGVDSATLEVDERTPLDIELNKSGGGADVPIRERFDNAVNVIDSSCG